MHIQHKRHTSLARTRHSNRFIAWIGRTATQLATTVSAVYADLLAGQTSHQLTATPPVAVKSLPPVIGGNPTSTHNATASTGSFTGNPAPTFTYQWLKDGANIVGQTANAYTVLVGDIGHTIAVKVTATNTYGAVSVISAGVVIAS